MAGLPVIAHAPVTLRHIKRGSGADFVTVLGARLVAQRRKGINGKAGYQGGSYERPLGEEGTATITLPNSAGSDGVLHRRRFLYFTADTYHAGDEWIEVLQEGRDRPLFVGTPVDGEKGRSTLTLELWDGMGMLATQRETAAGFWCHAPRDVFEHYSKGWLAQVAEDFPDGLGVGRWIESRATGFAGGVTLRPVGPVDPADAAFINAAPAYWGTLDLAAHRAWRLEASFERKHRNRGISTGDSTAQLAMIHATSGVRLVGLAVFNGGSITVIGTDAEVISRPDDGGAAKETMAIECRDRWVLFYVNGSLVHSRELDITTATPAVAHFSALTDITSPVNRPYVNVMSMLLRRCDPYLMRGGDKGDYKLPGSMPPGGLRGAYYDEANLRGRDGLDFARRALAPTRQPYARRQDPTVDFERVAPATWQPPTPPNGEFFSARWTGAIWLDLQAADVTLRLKDIDAMARMWVGKTMYGQHIVQFWGDIVSPATIASGSMRTHLGTVSGWYPIRIDYNNGGNQAGIILEQSIGGGAYTVVPESSLSPYGIYEAQVRYDSHIEQLKAIALAFAYQFTCEPRPLESGEFPGQIAPRARIGRDTDKILTPDETVDARVKVTATDVIDTLLADAAGLSDQDNAAQLTAEQINYPTLLPSDPADRHMMILSAYESLADITDPGLLQTRLASMLGLRLTPWQEVAARPRGLTELRDTFPLTGDLALFDWEPGSGLRLEDDQLDLRDLTPRQIIAPSWPFAPDGRGAPSVRFRQRPRSNQDAMRALIRAVLLPQRNYQGQLAVIDGSYAFGPDGDTRSHIALPANLDDILKAELIVSFKSDASTWTIQDAATTTNLFDVASTGHYDVLAHLKRNASSFGGASQVFGVTRTGGTGTISFQLRLVVKV